MRLTAAFVLAFVMSATSAMAQSGGGGSGGGSSGGAAASSSAGAAVSTGTASSAASAPGANAIPGTNNHSGASTALQNAPGTPDSQPNSYNALEQNSSANQMGTIGGSNSNGAGVAAPGSPVGDLSSTSNVGVMAPGSP